MQRQRGGVHDNPSTNEFMKNTQALRVVGTFHMTGVKRGNCRGGIAESSTADVNAPLPKRRRSCKKSDSKES